MSKQQEIYFDNSPDFFKVFSGGLIEDDTEVLTLYFCDTCDSHALCLVGDRLEWKPEIWMQHERERLEKMKEINIVCLKGDLTDFYHDCQKKFANVKINYYGCDLYNHLFSLKLSLANKKYLSPAEGERKNNIYSSIGTMRLNRYILIREGYDKGYDFYHPAISLDSSRRYENLIGRCLGKTPRLPQEFPHKRLFGDDMDLYEFNSRQIQILSDTYINFVATFPSTNFAKDREDEKYFDTILCKTVPFMLSGKNSNSTGLEQLGFLPYVGFDLRSDNIDEPVLRWKSLLKDNERIFKDRRVVKDLYDMNRYVIDHNYDRLVNTDWETKQMEQFKKLPVFVKEYLSNRQENQFHSG